MPLYCPVTPGGTICTWLVSASEDGAWQNLLADAAHMPYKGREGFEARGYSVIEIPQGPVERPVDAHDINRENET